MFIIYRCGMQAKVYFEMMFIGCKVLWYPWAGVGSVGKGITREKSQD